MTKNYRIIAFLLVIPLLILSSMILVHGQSSSTRTEFSNYFDLPSCELDGSGWWVGTSFEPTSSIDYNCYIPEVDPSSSNTCCPLQQSCNRNTGKCESTPEINVCPNYKTQSSCLDYIDPVAINDVEIATRKGYCIESEYNFDGGGCTRYHEGCKCFWNSTSQSCQSSVNYTTQCENEIPISNGKCTFNIKSQTNCTDNYKFIEWDASWSEDISNKPAECESGRKRVKCFSSELNFFGILGIIIVIVLIVIFYLIFNRKGKKNKTRKKSKK